jgi:superfamily I DNA/RNA helicase
MTTLAVTTRIATWLSGKPGLIDSLHQAVANIDSEEGMPPGNEMNEGPYRFARSQDGQLLCMWDTDYLSGTGDEPWGFIELTGAFGILNEETLARVVLERCIYVIGQRLQGLTIDGSLFPRAYENGTHTCLAGRGSEARQLSIGYVERHVGAEGLRQHSLICVGPVHDFQMIIAGAQKAGLRLRDLVQAANALIRVDRKSKLSDSQVLRNLRDHLRNYSQDKETGEFKQVEVAVANSDIDKISRHIAAGLTYAAWCKADSPLSNIQRRILESDAIEQHPLRIIGPAGSGKTLLMQLLALRRLRRSDERGEDTQVLYVVHNIDMAKAVRQRLEVLMSDIVLSPTTSKIRVSTLSELAREFLQLDTQNIIDADANEAKEFQLRSVCAALRAAMDETPQLVSSSPLLAVANSDPAIFKILAVLIVSEISIAIKGHGLERDRKRYVESAKALSRFHGILKAPERSFVFGVFQRYHHEVFESLEVLDSDDLAISLLGRLRTPIWELRRRQVGYDYVFVDETQLFNENERRIFPLLTRGTRGYIPIVIALDDAQAIFGQTSAGFAALGLEGLASEILPSIHRSTRSIVELAFFVIQRSADLFGPDFPDFTKIADRIESDDHPLAARPRIDFVPPEQESLGRFVRKRLSELRKANLRQIAVIVHTDRMWDAISAELVSSDLPLQMVLTRGERIPPDQPLVVLTKPAFVGGQEFDAVVLVGLEQGLVPPSNIENEALSAAVEQQALREIYLSVTRARYRVVVIISNASAPTPVLAEAYKHGLLDTKS